jgi:putative transposase
MTSFIDEHRGDYGVEPICRVLPIAPSTYHERVAQRRDPSRLSPRAQRDEAMKPEVRRMFDANFKVYGVRKVWRQMQREGFDIARCTVERLMRELGLQGVIRGKPVKTTVSDKVAPCPLDQVNRQFHAPAPNMLWVSDFTYLATWSGCASSTSWAMSVISQSRHTSGHRRGNAKHLTDTDEVIIHHVQRDGIGVVLDLL